MILYITRHGQVLPPSPDKPEDNEYPAGDRPLSELGRKQAVMLGNRLKNLGFGGQVYSSSFLRAVGTARIVAGITGSRVEISQAIREIDKLSETEDDVLKRAVPLINELLEKDTDALLVGHGTTIYNCVRYITREYSRERCEKSCDNWNCSFTAFEFKPDFKILYMGDTAHLPAGFVTSNAHTL